MRGWVLCLAGWIGSLGWGMPVPCVRVADPVPAGKAQIRVESVVQGLEVPWSLAFLPEQRLLIAERPGRLRLVEKGQLLPTPVAQITTDPKGEGGLQGLALHPDFPRTRLIYVYFTAPEAGGSVNRLERWRLSADFHSATFDRRLWDRIPAAKFHHGGRIRVGPDRMLYVSVGDATIPDAAQDLQKVSGKILRLDLDGRIPKDNPWPGNPAWVMGVRNSEGFDWRDPHTLLLADHGPSGELGRTGNDEVSVVHRGDNLGWPTVFGCQSQAGLETPSIDFVQAMPPGGAAIYRGKAIPEWKDSLLVGVLGARQLLRLVFRGDQVVSWEGYLQGDPPSGYGRLREVVMGPDGQLYLTTSNCDGRGTCPKEKDQVLRITR